MAFIRGEDPKKALDVGLSKNAIKIRKIRCHSNGNIIEIVDDYTIQRVLEDFVNFQLCKDPIFGPQRIDLVTYKHDEEKSGSIFSEPDLAHLGDYAGKIVSSDGKLYRMPSLVELDQKGYRYLIDYEEKRLRVENEFEKMRINTYYGTHSSGKTFRFLPHNYDPEINIEIRKTGKGKIKAIQKIFQDQKEKE